MLVIFHYQPLRLLEEVVTRGFGLGRVPARARHSGEMTPQCKHCIDKKRSAIRCLALLSVPPGIAPQEISEEEPFRQGGEVRVVPGEIHVHQVDDQISVLGDLSPRDHWVLIAQNRVCWQISRVTSHGAACHAHWKQTQARCCPNELHLALRIHAQGTDFVGYIGFQAWWGIREGIVPQLSILKVGLIVALFGRLGHDLGCDIVQTLAVPDVVDQLEDFIFWVIQNCLDEGL
ncbi:hypothetical protein ABW21_db0208766 [Orbilia brochopaga]|nr:hypothetical protein ABW21_db0208766 [Drechslerella brochopaga]